MKFHWKTESICHSLTKCLTCDTNLGADMKHPVPQIKSILGFMQIRGWAVAEKDKGTIYLTPPSEMVFHKPVRFEMPAAEQLEGYPRFIIFTVSSIAEMYDFKYQVLYDLFCFDYGDVENLLAPRETAVAA